MLLALPLVHQGCERIPTLKRTFKHHFLCDRTLDTSLHADPPSVRSSTVLTNINLNIAPRSTLMNFFDERRMNNDEEEEQESQLRVKRMSH